MDYLDKEKRILDEVTKFTSSQNSNIKKILIICLSISNKVKKEIIRLCLKSNVIVDIIESFHAAYILERPEKMPWFNKNLDSELRKYLIDSGISEGHFLDIGTGARDQAIALSDMGFAVTATDISEIEFFNNKKVYRKINFLEDDILNTKLNEKFKFINDRGCFHNIIPKSWETYIEQVLRLLDDDGLFF